MTAHIPPYKSFMEQDNLIRHQSDLNAYSKLRPVFDRRHGTVTAANSSPLTDGASAVLLMCADKAKELGIEPLAYIKSYAFSAIDVQEDMLMGPSYATPLALERAGLSLKDVDLIEMHEAFSAQVLTNVKMFGSRSFAKKNLIVAKR